MSNISLISRDETWFTSQFNMISDIPIQIKVHFCDYKTFYLLTEAQKKREISSIYSDMISAMNIDRFQAFRKNFFADSVL